MKNITLYLLCFFVNTSNFILAQTGESDDLLKFKGSFQINSEPGSAEFSYFRQDTLEKLSGPFKYESEFFDENEIFIQRFISGNYESGKKNGKWTYLDNKYNIDIKTVTPNLELISDLSGSKSKLDASFDLGNASGLWKYEMKRVENGKLGEVLKVAEAEFKEGRKTGSFSFEENENSLLITKINGSFDSDHFFHGKWELEYVRDGDQYSEIREYDHGFLVNLSIENKTQEVMVHDINYQSVTEKLAKIRAGEENLGYAIGDRSFGVLFDDGFPSISEKETSQLPGNKLMVHAFQTFSPETVIGLELDGIERIGFRGTRRFEYTFTSMETEALNTATELVAQYTSDIQKFINNSSLSLNRQKSDSLAFAYKFLDNALGKIEKLDREIERLKSEEFQYQSRDFYYADGIEGIDRFDTISYTFDGETRQRIFDNEVDLSGDQGIVMEILAYLEQKASYIDKLDPFMRESLVEIERGIISQQLDEDILDYIDSLENTYDVERGFDALDEDGIPLTNFHLAMYYNYQQVLDTKRQAYSNAETFEERQVIGLEIIDLTQVYLEAYTPIGNLRRRFEILDEAYTRYDYNPYMDRHDIKNRIKRNIYYAAVDHLLPYYRNTIIQTDDYRELPELIEEMESAFDRLLEIAALPDSETRSLERRLRRETNPERIKRQLDL